MNATDYRKWASERGVKHGSGGPGIECADVAEAEAYVRDYPESEQGFATCGSVEVAYTDATATSAAIKSLLAAAGYRWSQERRRYERDGYWAVATSSRRLKYAQIYVYPAAGQAAWACGEDGYLPPDDQP